MSLSVPVRKHFDVVLDTTPLHKAGVQQQQQQLQQQQQQQHPHAHAHAQDSTDVLNGHAASDDDLDDGALGMHIGNASAGTALLRRRERGDKHEFVVDVDDLSDESVIPRDPGPHAAVFHAGELGSGSNSGAGHATAADGDRLYFATSFWRMYAERTMWLVGLLLLQSYASLILERFEALLQKHLVITLFLPMLIGAGGNASNQSAMVVVRGIALGEVTPLTAWRLVSRELCLAVVIGGTMGFVAFVRVYLFHAAEGIEAALAVSSSLLAVMLLAVSLGTLIPLALNFVKIDPAHAGPVVAVLVDLSGVLIICVVCQLIFGG
jgi:cation transporter-like permease